MAEPMPRKPSPKWDDPEESKRFLETAKTVEASDDAAEFDRALKIVVSNAKANKDSH